MPWFSLSDFRASGITPEVAPRSRLAAGVGLAVLLLVLLSLAGCSADKPTGAVTGLPDFSGLVSANNASVVNINAIKELPALPRAKDERSMGDLLKKFFGQQGTPKQAPQQPERMSGSGFIISDDGYVLTNEHVIDRAAAIYVRLTDGRVFKAKVIGSDSRGDIALLKIDAAHLKPVALGDSDRVRPGQWAVAIGSPFGFDHSVTAGIISAKGRSLPSENNETYVPFIQTDVAINPGNSGGPLFDVHGRVIGINAQIFTESGGYNGLSFAIPINYAMQVVEQLKTSGSVQRGFLGVRIQPVSRGLAEALGLDRPAGALIAGFVSGSPAEKADLQVGDVILAVNERPIKESDDLPQIIGLLAPGSKVMLKVLRDGKTRQVNLRLATLPEHLAGLGQTMKSEDLVLDAYGLLLTQSKDRHVAIKAVQPGSVAAAADLKPGDVLVSINRQAINTLKQVSALIKANPKGAPLLLLLRRDGQQHYLTLESHSAQESDATPH